MKNMGQNDSWTRFFNRFLDNEKVWEKEWHETKQKTTTWKSQPGATSENITGNPNILLEGSGLRNCSQRGGRKKMWNGKLTIKWLKSSLTCFLLVCYCLEFSDIPNSHAIKKEEFLLIRLTILQKETSLAWRAEATWGLRPAMPAPESSSPIAKLCPEVQTWVGFSLHLYVGKQEPANIRGKAAEWKE